MTRALCAVVMCLASGAVGAVLMQAQQNSVHISTDDFTAIQRLLYANHTGYDFASRDNGDLWTSTFAPDAVLDNPPTRLVGEKAIRAYATDPVQKTPDRKLRHWTTTFHVTPAPEGAILSAVYLIISDPGGKGMAIGGTGRH